MRLPTKCGTWYPKPPELEDTLERLFVEARKTPTVVPQPDLRFLIAPHAGMAYSGLTAAHSFACIDPAKYDLVVMLGVCHAFHQRGLSCSPFSRWANPLNGSHLQMEKVPGLPLCESYECEEEHSLELEVPYLAYVFRDQLERRSIKFTAIYAGYGVSSQEVDLLQNYIENKKVLFVVSSDFCHYGPRFGFSPSISGKTADEVVTEMDKDCINGVILGYDAFESAMEKTKNTVCGRYTIGTFLRLAESSGWELTKKLLYYTKSDNPRTSRDHSVSYTAIIGILKEPSTR
ncbi:Cell motility MEMO family protein [Giardia muris]|uniref:Cell motility MEMO family protein n=1 Tax=Giardia muris TaxID=5742 RepID=A0A4Z1SV03_GIAMU|nr:Cell motility MEMO family protein [Giardia muris]|eukprot:TNJ29656.1 Cell motility MEMO family protein [Giardia muris]